jgi:hypothetical protein
VKAVPLSGGVAAPQLDSAPAGAIAVRSVVSLPESANKTSEFGLKETASTPDE